MTHDNDTIIAPASATGGAIAIIRVSGRDAVRCVDTIFRGQQPLLDAKGYTLHYGEIVDAERTVDDVLVTLFRAPNSYTGEDSVEISHHGSAYISSQIMELLLRSGARTATAGEFTMRAFLNGKLDLSQAEAVADIIASSSEAEHRLASTQMRGGYSTTLDAMREELLRLTSLLELELDFGEEDVEFADRAQIRNIVESILAEVQCLESSFALGNAIKEGIAVAIVGAPNVGKSTLLNRLLNEDRAMVSSIAGTTRDVIEEAVVIDGVRFRFLDTAGIHQTDDRLERMGIERTMQSIERADIVIELQVAGERGDDSIRLNLAPQQRHIRVINKIDLNPKIESIESVIGVGGVEDVKGAYGTIAISAKSGEGIDRLCTALRTTIDTTALYNGNNVVSSLRHREALTDAKEALFSALKAIDDALPTDLLSEEIRQVVTHIAHITGNGAITTDEVLATIFSKFCIGK